MTPWDVSKLIGARVLFPAKDVGGNFGEIWGTITGILDTHLSEREAMATNLSEFSVRIDTGELLHIRGQSFARIVAEPRLPPD
jgi:hypothetical protein